MLKKHWIYLIKYMNKNYFSSSLWSNKDLAYKILNEVLSFSSKIKRKINIMEVCGTHTMSIASSGIRNILPDNVNLISGPGCPVCVTSAGDIDRILELAKIENVIITTFGDMVKVKGSNGFDLNKIRAFGGEVKVVYSPLDALKIAKENPTKKIIFIGVGFETTAPLIAYVVKMAHQENVNNFYIVSLFKLVPPALKFLLDSKIANIDAFILPGHVSTVIGYKSYDFLIEKYKIPSVIAGFEPLDILRAISLILKQIYENKILLEVEYFRAVNKNGNQTAISLLNEVFKESDANWRAVGKIPLSGYTLSKKYIKFDAFNKFNISEKTSMETKGCLCGKIILGLAKPSQCRYFGKECTPSDAIGPCMVSSEGACAAWYKYGIKK